MHRTTKTDPFTGLEMKAVKMQSGNLIVSTPFEGSLLLEYDAIGDMYRIPAAAFEHRQTMTLRETSEELGVSRMRVSRMCCDGTLRAAKINGAMVIDAFSVKSFKEKRDDGND